MIIVEFHNQCARHMLYAHLLSIQITEGDLNCELDTYKQSRQGLDEMYNEARRQLKEECQLRQVCLYKNVPVVQIV